MSKAVGIDGVSWQIRCARWRNVGGNIDLVKWGFGDRQAENE